MDQPDPTAFVATVRELRKMGALNEIGLVAHLDALAQAGKQMPHGLQAEDILPPYDLRVLIWEFLAKAPVEAKGWFVAIDGELSLAERLRIVLAPRPAPAPTRQQIVTDHVRKLLKSVQPLPPQRTIVRDLRAEHGGKFCQEQVRRAIRDITAENAV